MLKYGILICATCSQRPRWLRHFSASGLDVPTLAGGLSP
jgi:hypothetical protein